ncbi:MAG: chlorophyll synthesis pathway protein BchC [Myxococcota bacterium]
MTEATAVVLQEPERLTLSSVELTPPSVDDVVVEVDFSGISTGTERLLWSGRMPPFPGMGYPLVPGYESVGRVVQGNEHVENGTTVFVPGSNGFVDVRGLFGGAASTLVVPSARVIPIASDLGEQGVLLALAATAQHALGDSIPDLIVGHGVLGRLLARLAVARGGAPTVWETDSSRLSGAEGYRAVLPESDAGNTYSTIVDVSGDVNVLDRLVGVLKRGGEIVLAGFYSERVNFAFPPAFMKEARFRIAAEWQPNDLVSAHQRVVDGTLSLDGLITHRRAASDANEAYRAAFTDPNCLKMLLDWRDLS